MSWVMSTIRRSGRDVEHHRVAHADELVDAAVVGQERDERRTIGHRRLRLRLPHRSTSPTPPCVGFGCVSSRLGVARGARYASTSGSDTRNDRPDPHRRQLTGLDQPVDGHRRHPHQIRDFLHREKARFAQSIAHAELPTPDRCELSVRRWDRSCRASTPVVCVRSHLRVGDARSVGQRPRDRPRGRAIRSSIDAGSRAGGRSVRIGTNVHRPPRAAADRQAAVGRGRRTPRPRRPLSHATSANGPSAITSAGRGIANIHSRGRLAVARSRSSAWPSLTTATPPTHRSQRGVRPSARIGPKSARSTTSAPCTRASRANARCTVSSDAGRAVATAIRAPVLGDLASTCVTAARVAAIVRAGSIAAVSAVAPNARAIATHASTAVSPAIGASSPSVRRSPATRRSTVRRSSVGPGPDAPGPRPWPARSASASVGARRGRLAARPTSARASAGRFRAGLTSQALVEPTAGRSPRAELARPARRRAHRVEDRRAQTVRLELAQARGGRAARRRHRGAQRLGTVDASWASSVAEPSSVWRRACSRRRARDRRARPLRSSPRRPGRRRPVPSPTSPVTASSIGSATRTTMPDGRRADARRDRGARRPRAYRPRSPTRRARPAPACSASRARPAGRARAPRCARSSPPPRSTARACRRRARATRSRGSPRRRPASPRRRRRRRRRPPTPRSARRAPSGTAARARRRRSPSISAIDSGVGIPAAVEQTADEGRAHLPAAEQRDA